MRFPSFYMMLVLYCLELQYMKCMAAGNNDIDGVALLQIRSKITDDPLGVMGSWNDTLHFCEWYGVTCGRRHQRVTMLRLPSSKLAGTLSPYVGNLSFLRELVLLNNSLSGTIPPEIGRLHRLQIFNLERNYLVGCIPSSLGNLSSLTVLQLGTNNLVGSIPDSLGRLKFLIILSLVVNKLSGEVPLSIFNLSALEVLNLGVNHLEGRLDSYLGAKLFPNLQFFSIGSNRFTGSIPASISNFSNLEALELNGNNLTGQVPSLNKLHKLNRFTVADNILGNGQLADLDFISSLVNATMLEIFIIDLNKFGGTVPTTICNFSMLTVFSMEANKIGGQIPSCIENLSNLEVFAGEENDLSGAIPLSIGKLQNLIELYFDHNQLSGYIPFSIGNLTKLARLNLNKNNLQGHIPSTLGSCRNLEGLDLSQNNLSGSIPSQLLSISTLTIALYLNNNHLMGSLSAEVGQLKNLVSFDISNNMLSGEIPTTLGACIQLEGLSIGGNFFKGSIPPTLVTLKSLSALDLSSNNLSGNIPKFLAGLPLLQMLNLSYNLLEGEVPTSGVFSNASTISLFGNKRLCGGIPELKLPQCNLSTKTHKRRQLHKLKLVLAILCGFSGVILLVALASLYAFCYRRRSRAPKTESENSLVNLSYQSLVKATNDFSSDNLIGTGTFGSVYKGIIDHENQTVVAIKKFKLEHKGASKSFMAECGALRNIRHRNLVKVITACSSTDNQRNDFKALVYEYMVNGSLEDWLHPNPIRSFEDTNDAPRNLNLLQRFGIIVDVAFALEYLHHRCGSRIVHCDLKPSNVLLDEEMVAHVGDFGLAKFLSNDIASSHENVSSSIGVRGTIGYAPPEYGLGNEVSTCGDVYSFGILVMEMFTGKRPTDNMFKEGMSLHSFVKAALPDRVLEIMDHDLFKDIVGDQNTYTTEVAHSSMILEALISVLRIALSCSAELPQQRLNMSDVAANLSLIWNNLLGTWQVYARVMSELVE